MNRRIRLSAGLVALGFWAAAQAQTPVDPPPTTPPPMPAAVTEAREALRAAARRYAEALEAEGLPRPQRMEGKGPWPRGLNRGYLGLKLGAPTAGEPGLPVEAVAPDSGAAAAGLRAGDRLLAIGEVVLAVEGRADGALRQALRGLQPGETVSLRYQRDGVAQTATLTLGAMPLPPPGAFAGRFDEGPPTPPLMHLAPMNAELAAYFGGQDRGVLVLAQRQLAGIQLQGGDIIVEVNGVPVEGLRELARGLWRRDGDAVQLTVVRAGARLQLEGAPRPRPS